jgi:hypothetical protein
MITRRSLILGAAGLAAAGGVGWYVGSRGFEARIAAVLHRRLDYLRLDPDGVRRFARDQVAAVYGKKVPTWNRLKYHFLSAVAPSFTRYYRSTDHRSRLERLEDGMVTTFLLSSDFFLNKADESRIVQYIAYYDPSRPCQNPFARPAVGA